MAAVAIRQATAADADAIADLIALNDPRDLVSQISRDERRDRFVEGLSSGEIAALLAEADGRLVGELTLVLRHPSPTEIGFGVHPEWRRRGVARELVRHAIAWADEHDIHKLTAQVLSHNAAALALLAQEGFSQEGFLTDHFARANSEASDAVLLARLLR